MRGGFDTCGRYVSSHRRLFARLFIGLGFAATVAVAVLPASPAHAESTDEISSSLGGKSCTVAGSWPNAPTGPVTLVAGQFNMVFSFRCFLNPTTAAMDTKVSAVWAMPLTGTIPVGGSSGGLQVAAGSSHNCAADSTWSFVDRGQKRLSTGVVSGTATRPGLPINYFEVLLGCKSASSFTAWNSSSQFTLNMSHSSVAALGTDLTTGIQVNMPCQQVGTSQLCSTFTAGGQTYSQLIPTYKTSAPAWSTPVAEPDHFGPGGGFVHTNCENAPTPFAVGGETLPFTVEPGDSVVYRVESDDPDEPPLEDGVRIWVRWSDGYGAFQWKELLDVPTTGGVTQQAQATLTRSSFATATTSELVYYRCLDENAETPEYQYSTGDGAWGWEEDLPDIEPCSGVVLTDYGEGAYFAGSELTITLNVTLSGVEKIQADIGGADVFETLTGTPTGPGAYDPIPTGSYVLDLIPYGSEPVARVDGDWRDLQVRCWDGVRTDGGLIAGTEDGNFQGAEGNLFQRPEGEPPVSQCRDQDWGDNPLDWAPAVGKMAVCFMVRLFVPGEFHDEVFDERWNATTLIGWLLPASIISDAYSDLTSATGNCDLSYDMPAPIPNIDLHMCEGTVGDMRTMSRHLSTLAIGLWAANRTAAKVMRILTGQYENWIEPHDTYDADMGMTWRENGSAGMRGRYYS